MDRLTMIGSLPPAWQALPPANSDADSSPAAWPSTPDPDPAIPLGLDPSSPADQGRMLNFMSHVNAECFISLLQTMDPIPADGRARAEYLRYYRQMRESLEIPLLNQDAQPEVGATDPAK